MDSDGWFDLDATGQAALVRHGQVTAVELVDAAIAHAERLNPQVNAIVIERFERARAEAASSGAGPFAGVPIVLKDLGAAVAGEPTYLGTRGLRRDDYRAAYTSAVARRLSDAGFIAIGRSNTPEWGTTITTEPLSFGPSRNPWNLDHSTGGSSGGTAAAVAARIVALGHAGDGGGSIRIPASACGLVGLKPSRARISHAPEGEGWAGAATDGAITRTVRDAAAVLDVLAGYEPGDDYTAPPLARPLVEEVGVEPGPLRIGVTTGQSSGKPIGAECIAAVDRAAALLASLGHHVESDAPALLDDPGYFERFLVMVAAHTATARDLLEGAVGRVFDEEDLEADNLSLSAVGRAMSATTYLKAITAQSAWSRQVQSWWYGADAFDLLVCPVITNPPPKLGWLGGPHSAERIAELLLYTGQFNVTGQPAISLPLHWTPDGLPIGVQLVAAAGREDVLIRVAAQLEIAAPWATRRPPVCVTSGV